MTISWTMVNDFLRLPLRSPPPWNHSFAALRKTKECVIAIPAVDMLIRSSGSGRVPARIRTSLKKFALTPMKGRHVKAPLVRECLANIECRVVDIVRKHNIVVLEGVAAYYDAAKKEKRTACRGRRDVHRGRAEGKSQKNDA